VSRPALFDLGGGAVLRRYTLDDADEMFAVVDANRERLRLWLPWIDPMRTADDERTWLAGVLANEEAMEAYGIFVEGRFAGGVGLAIDPFSVFAEIGYWIGEAFEGRGLVTNACRTLIDYAFTTAGLHRIVIRAAPENLRSCAIPERLGFTKEGVAREEGKAAGGFHDLALYGLLETEWPSR
jgi:ribosomal-protein-serine acetyltransferase